MLKLQLVEDDEILWEIPLEVRQWNQSNLIREFDELEEELQRFEDIFQVMRMFLEDFNRPLGFTELMNELGMNPKIVSDSTKRLRSTGLIDKDEKGKYRSTRTGEAQFLMMSIAMRRMLEFLERI
jgi:Mn-dependent DtxR family transcriptional regulator